MEIKATFAPYELNFKQASGTSRGNLNSKTSYFIKLKTSNSVGFGECGLLKGLSYDNLDEYEAKLQWVCDHIELGVDALWELLTEFPSIQFGVEQAFLSLHSSEPFLLFPSAFTKGEDKICMNGLVWMGSEEFMRQQIDRVLEGGFNCVKMKIGAIEWEKELHLLQTLRKRYDKSTLEIRVDANGAFNLKSAQKVLEQLAILGVHSIEQPIGADFQEDLALLCAQTPVAIALDESLIPCISAEQKSQMLDFVKPQYIILKPSFIGGFRGSDYWISLAKDRGIGWWATSALESNVGLNAISQWVYTKGNNMPQGLGTGSLYTNNISSPLYVKNGAIAYEPNLAWDLQKIDSLCM